MPNPNLGLRLADEIDFPESVTALAAGRLGFPHRGFPAEVQRAILKGAEPLPFGVRSSASLPAADFEAERSRMVQLYDRQISDEEVREGRPGRLRLIFSRQA